MDCVEKQTEYYNLGHGRQPVALDVQQQRPLPQERRLEMRRRCHHFTALSLLFWFMLYKLALNSSFFDSGSSHLDPKDNSYNDDLFDWDSIHPSKDLRWHDCFKGLECARLEVPLDYSNSDNTQEHAAIAILRSRSPYTKDDPRYRGPILFNPGGPGGSGTAFVQIAHTQFRIILGQGYDLVGFDPRGTGFTTPSLSIFNSKVDAGAFFSSVSMNVNATPASLGELLAKASLIGDIAKSRSSHVAEYVSTPNVARDMLSIVEAYGREKLQYWGFSYGTVLGATFAAMFPDKVERLIIDGVVDSFDYYGSKWSNNLRDTDKDLFTIYEACVEAGPERCPLHEAKPELIHERVVAILESLKTRPIAVYSAKDDMHLVVDYGAAKYALFSTLYSPYALGSYAMQMLAQLEKGDARMISLISFQRAAESLVRCDCSVKDSNRFTSFFVEPLFAIACGDGEPVLDGYDDLKKFYGKLGEASTFGEVWFIHGFCAGWKIRTKAPFTGSFKQNTSYPILLIGNTADPVTPLWNAHKMSKEFNNSVVLTQDSPGHCSLAAASLCTMKAISEYFINGTLPEKGTVCDVQGSIFGGESEFQAYEETLNDEDRKLFIATKELHRKVGVRKTLL